MRVESEPGEGMSEMRSAIAENTKLTREMAGSIKKIRRYIFWMQLTGWIKFLILVVPLLIAAIYLPPIISNLQKTYGELLGGGTKDGVNVGDLLKSPELQEMLKNGIK